MKAKKWKQSENNLLQRANSHTQIETWQNFTNKFDKA